MSGSIRQKRYDVLREEIDKRGCRRGAELGVLGGATIFRLLDHCPELSMIGVDQWQLYPGSAYSQELLDRARREFHQRAPAFGDRLIIIEASTVTAAEAVADDSLDFVFIDADHSTDAVVADIEAWLPKIKPDGFISGHDADWDSVEVAVRRMCKLWQLMPDDVWLAEHKAVRGSGVPVRLFA